MSEAGLDPNGTNFEAVRLKATTAEGTSSGHGCCCWRQGVTARRDLSLQLDTAVRGIPKGLPGTAVYTIHVDIHAVVK